MTSDPQPGTPPLYRDRLVCITDSSITFFRYSFPFLGRKEVALSDIDHIVAAKPSLANGRWRIWGSGDLITWFPLDGARPSRDRIFIATLVGRRMKIGFTVEDSARVTALLRSRGIEVREED
ncbi:MAG TPA: hypothetical protein VEI81_06850 [Methanoregula sp.]|nr:hypothetical protein [Methanoregula sp.]